MLPAAPPSACPATLDELPLYVRAGAIIPHQPVVQHTDEVPQGPLELRVYVGEDCRGSLYLDDGKTFAYSQGDYLRIHYTCQSGPEALQMSMSEYEGKFLPWWKKVRLGIFGVEKRPKEVQVGPKTLNGWVYDSTWQKLTLEIPDTPAADEIRVLF
jgi:alpha-glucosidase